MILGQEIIYTLAMFISKSMDDQDLSDEQFKRPFGVYKQTYRKMVESVKSEKSKSGRYIKGKKGVGCWDFRVLGFWGIS